jgi:hypothetical protein
MRGNLNSLVQRYGLTALIGLLILVAIVVIGWETGWARYLSPGVPKFESGQRKSDEIALLPPFTLPPVDPTFKETVERPLFNQTRRPNPPALAATPQAPAMEKGKYRLTGTSVNAELSTAFLVDTRTGKTLRVAKGAVVDPLGSQLIKLERVDPTGVVLKFGDESETLSLTTSKSTMVAQVTPQPGVPGAPPLPGGVPSLAQPPLPGQAAPPAPGFAPGPSSTPSNIYGPGGPFGNSGGAAPPPPTAEAAVPVPAAPALTPAPGAANTPGAPDQPTALRRRRFQNLPQ